MNLNDKKVVSTPDAPKAIGPYSQAVRIGNMLYLSGQIPLDPRTGELVTGDLEVQTDQVMRNIKGVLNAEGLNMSHIIKTTVFLKDMGEFARFNAAYEKHLSSPFPARSTVEVARLPRDVKIEIETIAYYP